jgi:membrane peptidoglycan carboxypeptidase
VWIGYPSGEIPMLNVHGIAVSGPTFPAQIWHTFMGTAIGNRPDVPFPPATTQPVWTSWRGQYEYSGAYGTATTTTTDTGATTTASKTRTTSPVTTQPATTAPPPTVVPPTTTAAPPLPTTTEPAQTTP